MMPTIETSRSARIEARIAPEVLAVVRRAAELQGRSVSDFLVASAKEAAYKAIEESQVIRLAMDEQQRFADLLLNPQVPVPAMERAFEAHARLIRETR